MYENKAYVVRDSENAGLYNAVDQRSLAICTPLLRIWLWTKTGRGGLRVEGGRKGEHGAFGAIPKEEQRNHGSCLLRRPFALRRRLGAGKRNAGRRKQPLPMSSACLRQRRHGGLHVGPYFERDSKIEVPKENVTMRDTEVHPLHVLPRRL